MIINEDHWPNIMTVGMYDIPDYNKFTWHGAGGRLTSLIRDYSDADYWFVNIMSRDAFYHYPIETLMSLELIEKVRKKELKIVVCHYSEAYHDVIDGVYKHLIIHSNIPADQILFLTNSPDIITEINHISAKYNLPPMKAEWLITYEWDATVYANSKPHEIPDTALDTLNRSTYQKKFLSFNGQPRAHRIICMGLLCAYDLIPLGHISYNCYVYGKTIEELPTSEDYYNTPMLTSGQSNPEVHRILLENKEKICKLVPMFLDTSMEDQRSRGALHDTKKEYYEETYFSLVTETLCLQTESNAGETGMGRILSEKIFKAILNRHPFILLGVPKSLQLLRDLGYKTFSPWINEDYDNELDDITRIHMVVKEVKKLCELPDDKLAEFLIFAREIVEHNFNNVKSKSGPKSVPLPISFPLVTTPEQHTLYQPGPNNFMWFNNTPKLFEESNFTGSHSVYFGTPSDFFNEFGRESDTTIWLPNIVKHLNSDPTSILMLHYDWTPLPVNINQFGDQVIEFIVDYNINPDQVYLIIMDYLQIPSLVDYFAEKNIKIHVTGRNHLLINETIEYNKFSNEVVNLFSIFSRSYRKWRLDFFCDLIKENLLDKCIYSFALFFYSGWQDTIKIDHVRRDISPKYNNIKDRLDTWVDGIPYEIGPNLNDYYTESLSDAISQSNIHIVIETMNIGEDILVTEKTWKAISVQKPFMIYGVPGCLNWLHQHGYKTFHPFINESYDLVTNTEARKYLIIREMKRIAALSKEELDLLLENCKPAIEHNHKLFLKERNYEWPEDFAKLGLFK